MRARLFELALLFVCVWCEMPIEINRRKLAELEPMRNVSALEAFRSPACHNFYVSPDDRWGVVHNTMALEDLHKGGRFAAFAQNFMYQELVVSARWRFAYVVVRKSASMAILGALEVLFGATRQWCTQRCGKIGACYSLRPQLRCTTMALSATELRSYFFFSFVRNPMERWFSQYAQAHVIWRTTNSTPSFARARATLLELGERAFVSEHHLQTQTHSLTSTTHMGTTTPMHFIGRTESLERDWERVVREIWRRNDVVDFATRAVEPLGMVGHHEQQRDQFVAKLEALRSDESLRTLIREVYTQDFVCFGYN